MKIDEKTGRIAFHAYRLREDGGLDYVQYDYDGSIEYVREERPATEYKSPPLSS